MFSACCTPPPATCATQPHRTQKVSSVSTDPKKRSTSHPLLSPLSDLQPRCKLKFGTARCCLKWSMLAPSSGAASALHVLVLLCCYCVQRSQGFVVTTRLRDCVHKPRYASTEDSHGRDRGGAWGHTTGFRRRPTTRGLSLKAGQEGGTEEEDDTLEVTKGFYSEIAARLGKTAEGETSKVEEDSKEGDEDGEGVTEFDKAIYDELRARRDFGFEQDLGLELEKRNITKEAEVANIVDAGLEQIPGVSSSTTLFPNSELTPREVVTKVLEALKNNDHPYHNHGVEVFVRFLSPSSAMHGIEMAGVARYLAENRNRAFMHWDAIAYPRPLTLSGGAKQNKAFQPLKLKDTMTGSWHSVSVYLTLDPRSNCWLIESCIVKGEL